MDDDFYITHTRADPFRHAEAKSMNWPLETVFMLTSKTQPRFFITSGAEFESFQNQTDMKGNVICKFVMPEFNM